MSLENFPAYLIKKLPTSKETRLTGVYKITNRINGKIYIGQALSIFDRWKQHEKASRTFKNNEHLYNAIRKYGIQSFIFEIVEITPYQEDRDALATILNDRERYWIAYYDTLEDRGKGYNATSGGESGRCFSESVKSKLSEKHSGKVCYTDGSSNDFVMEGESVPDGFSRGMTKHGVSGTLGKKRYNNGSIERRFVEGEQPEGFVLGGLARGKIGKKCFTNGINNVFCYAGEEPEGWIPGVSKRVSGVGKNNSNYGNRGGAKNSQYGKKVYNNGVEDKKFFPGCQPEGWRLGSCHTPPNKGQRGVQTSWKKGLRGVIKKVPEMKSEELF